MRPVFADPKTDFIFKRLFGTDEHRDLTVALINALLALDDAHAIVAVSFLREEARPPVEELKFSIVDVRCTDATGTTYVVEMQVLNVEGFEKRVVYNASKAYVHQLASGVGYPTLNDVIAISICDFVLWDDGPGVPTVPLVSRWRMQEQHGGRQGLSQVQYVFVELPKFPMNATPTTVVEEWAYVFRRASELTEVPQVLRAPGPRKALDAARMAHLSSAEWETYDRAKVAEQDARGALTYAQRIAREEGELKGRAEGHAEGHAEGRMVALRGVLDKLLLRAGLTATAEQRARMDACDDLATMERWIDRALTSASIDEVLSGAVPPDRPL